MDEDRCEMGVSPMLTKPRLDEALTNWFGKQMKFTHWEYVGGTTKGESYLSKAVRMIIHGQDENGKVDHIRVFVKGMPDSISARLTLRSSESFRNEINFYTKILPVLLNFQKTKNLTEPFDIFPKVILAYTDGNNDYLGLEDLSVHFKSAYRQEGVDIKHTKLVFKTFAKFHAISFALKDQNPEVFDQIKTIPLEMYYSDELWDWYGKFWKRLCGIAVDAVEKEYPNSLYLEKVKDFARPETYKKVSDSIIASKENGIILHGDSWINNFLFKYENSVPIDTKMLDFQFVRCSSPVLDISFYIYGCTTHELREQHYDELLKYYYENLSKQIRELGSNPDKVYSWDLFMDEIRKYSFFGLALSFECIPFIILDPEDTPDMKMEGDQKLNINDIWTVTNFKTKEGRLREANNIVHCVDRGYI